MSVRPRLKTLLRPLRRGAGAVQFGISPELGVILDGLSVAEVTLLDRLDGSVDLPGLRDVAGTIGVPQGRLEELLGTLRQHRLLIEQPTNRARLSALRLSGAARLDLAPDAEALAVSGDGTGDGYGQISARGAHHVLVTGHGSLPDTIESLLLRAGIGTVSRSAGRVGDPDLVVLAGARALPVDAGQDWHSAGVVHLPVISLGHRVVIGPLVRPGAGPCLRCLHLHRSDRDPAWPMVLAQLVSGRPPLGAVQAETALGTVAAGLVAMIVHASIAGRPLPPGASLEIALPWPRIDHREWTAHPRCACAAEASDTRRSADRGAQATMSR